MFVINYVAMYRIGIIIDGILEHSIVSFRFGPPVLEPSDYLEGEGRKKCISKAVKRSEKVLKSCETVEYSKCAIESPGFLIFTNPCD